MLPQHCLLLQTCLTRNARLLASYHYKSVFSGTDTCRARCKGYEGVVEGVWFRQYLTESDTQGSVQGVLNHAKGPWVPLPWGQLSSGTVSLKQGSFAESTGTTEDFRLLARSHPL